MKRLLLTAGIALTTLLGCGGTGRSGGSGGGEGLGSLEITVSPQVINYGDKVTVSWTSKNLSWMNTDRQGGITNLTIKESEKTGSTLDRPGGTTTYALSANDVNGQFLAATATVAIRPSTKSFLLLGSRKDKLLPELIQLVRSFTTGTVSTGEKLPSTKVADVMVLLESCSITKADQPKVRSLLGSNGSLLFLGGALHKLAGTNGMNGESDISSVSDVFGGATVSYRDYGSDYNARDTRAKVPLSITASGRTIGHSTTGLVIVHDLSADATVILQSQIGRIAAFTFAPLLGGKVACLGALSFGSSEVQKALVDIFVAECRWLADAP